MQMEPTAVKGEDFPLPGTVSLHLDGRDGTFCRKTGFAQASVALQFAGGLSVPLDDLRLSMVNSEASLLVPLASKRTEVLTNKYFLMERCCPQFPETLKDKEDTALCLR